MSRSDRMALTGGSQRRSVRRMVRLFLVILALSLSLPTADAQELSAAAVMASGTTETVAVLQRRAAHGDATAAFRLGNLYTAADGVPPDETAAVGWYRAAADRGLPAAQLALGLRYALGEGVRRDLRLAHMWVNLAATRNVAGSWEARDSLVALMTAEELAGAVRLALAWRPVGQ